MKKALKILAIIATVMVTVLPLAACGDSSKTQSELDLLKETIEELTDRLDDLTTENGELNDRLDDLTTENGELNDRLDDLTTENGELTDKINGLNVFTSDKAEYAQTETMTVFFKNIPVLKIRMSFDTACGTPLWSFNCSLYITSLCADIYAESILGSMLLAWDNGTCVKKPDTSSSVLTQNVETKEIVNFIHTGDAYDNGTKFDIVICVPGTPFELARFKNVSHTK